MNADRIAELRALAEKATPGPWSFYYDAANDGEVISICEQREGGMVIADLSGGPAEADADNAAFIEAARTALPEALDEIERLRHVIRTAMFGATTMQQIAERLDGAL